MKKILIILLVFSISNSCKVYDPNAPKKKTKLEIAMDSWLGATEAKVIASWGPPTSSYKMDDGSKVLTWEQTSQSGGYTWYDYYGRQQYSAPVTRACKKQFYINSSGTIYSWRTEGC